MGRYEETGRLLVGGTRQTQRLPKTRTARFYLGRRVLVWCFCWLFREEGSFFSCFLQLRGYISGRAERSVTKAR